MLHEPCTSPLLHPLLPQTFDNVLRTQEEMFCDEFHLVDLRVFENCKKVSLNALRLLVEAPPQQL